MTKDLMEENERLWEQVATLRAASKYAGGTLEGALAMGHLPEYQRQRAIRALEALRAALAATDDCQNDAALRAERGEGE